ncbi:TadE/TadG family type IV pilus assembly protein [Chengkuizengella sediminis]|uniref:TadE/TadG family type IV pilus assembly protein n=1 Tax=Chengkuizengella sediminis TaxID=1885917 RepID=UPI001389EC02|nr:TadE family protein [Chengkuizengella sediminis]NDI35577.1 pilus assembly protein [Chengkuizengella sediminis]
MLKNKRGSLVLEASIVLPIFISAFLALISFLQIALAEMALHQAVNEATKLTVTHVYPIYVLKNHQSIQSFQNDITNMIPEELDFLVELQKENINHITDEILNVIFLPYLMLFIDEDILQKDQVQVIKVILPNLQDRQNAYFGIEASYSINLLLPFIEREVTIQKKSLERVWIGG